MDADAKARALLQEWMPQAGRDVGMAELRVGIAAALRRAREAGRAEAIEACLKAVHQSGGRDDSDCRCGAAIRALKEASRG